MYASAVSKIAPHFTSKELNISPGNQANIEDISQRQHGNIKRNHSNTLNLSEENSFKEKKKLLLFCPGFTCLTDYPDKWQRYQHLVCHNMNLS